MAAPNILAFGQRIQERFTADDPTVGAKALEQANVDAIQRQFAALAASNLDAFLDEMHPDVELNIFAPPEFPFVRRARGITEFRRAVEHNFAGIAEQRSEFLSLVAQGNMVVILGRERGTFRNSGTPYDVHFAYEFTFRDGKILRTLELAAPTGAGTP